MKHGKLVSLVMALVLALSLCPTAFAADYVVGNLPGAQISLEDGTPVVVLYGETAPEGQSDENTKAFLVIVQRENLDCAIYMLVTNTTTLLDAILDTGAGEVEEASWGYNVVAMDGIRASYQENGAWWGIECADQETGAFVKLMTGIQDTPIASNDVFLFTYSK